MFETSDCRYEINLTITELHLTLDTLYLDAPVQQGLKYNGFWVQSEKLHVTSLHKAAQFTVKQRNLP